MSPPSAEQEQLFWHLAEELLQDPAVTRSTMMGYPCLRVHGHFFACVDRRTGDLVVKVPPARVGELVADGIGLPFAPNGSSSAPGSRFPSVMTRSGPRCSMRPWRSSNADRHRRGRYPARRARGPDRRIGRGQRPRAHPYGPRRRTHGPPARAGGCLAPGKGRPHRDGRPVPRRLAARARLRARPSIPSLLNPNYAGRAVAVAVCGSPSWPVS
jgi:hypothetical protein